MRIACVLALSATFAAAACQSSESSPDAVNEPTATVAVDTSWVSLTADHWRGYRQDSLPAAWSTLDDGTLHFTGTGQGGDIVTREVYDNFRLALDWKISEGGNSGIMFRVSEEHDYPWRTGPEFQLLDDDNHPDAKEGDDRLAGANYDMHAPSARVVQPVGEWNSVHIIVHGAHVEHWMNGKRIVSYELGSNDWNERIANSKWIDMPRYGKESSGHVCLQDHGDQVWFQHIRIRRLQM